MKYINLIPNGQVVTTVCLQEIDSMINRLQEQGYNSAVRFGSRAFQYVTNLVMQTAIKVRNCGQGECCGLVVTVWSLCMPQSLIAPTHTHTMRICHEFYSCGMQLTTIHIHTAHISRTNFLVCFLFFPNLHSRHTCRRRR